MINSKYFRVPKKKEPLQEHEIHLTSKQDPINFLKYAIFLFEKRNLPYIKFKASGSAIAGLVNISEILKKVVPGVHQINRIYTLKYEQDYEPKEKGLDHVTIVRNVPILEISFYKELPELEMENWPGFQRALRPEIFERVRINFNNVIRKRNKGSTPSVRTHSVRDRDNQSQTQSYSQSRRGYSVGFRGGMNNNNRFNRGGGSVHSGFKPGFRGGRGGGFRGGFGSRQGGDDQYGRTGFKPGFRGGRGGRGGGFRGGRQQQGHVVYNDFSDHHPNQNYGGQRHDGYSEVSRASTVRGFPKYRSKFDNQTRKD